MQVQRQVTEIRESQITLQVPESFVNHRAEIIILTLDEETPRRRQPHPDIAGKLIIKGDLFDSVPEGDWDLPA